MSSEYLHKDYILKTKEYDAVVQCNRCGFCQTHCPTYMATGKETCSPRGRSQALRQILEGKIRDPQIAHFVFSSCLACHACQDICYSGVPVGRLVGHGRTIVMQKNFVYRLISFFLFRVLLLRRSLFSAVVWVALLCKRLHISAFLKYVGVLKILSPELDIAEKTVPVDSLMFGARPKKQLPAIGKPKVAYFSGCGMHYLYPSVCRDWMRIAQSSGFSVECPSHACCGLAAQSAGDIDSAKFLARKNIDLFLNAGYDLIVANDDSCCGYMKSYGDLLNADPKALAFAKKVRNLSEFLAENLPPINAKPVKKIIKVTYHHSCQMGRGQDAVGPPKKILSSLPGVDFVEMEESTWCCGGAGTYHLKHPEISEDVLRLKIANIQKTGASVVVVQAASCLMQIQYGLRKHHLDRTVQAMHLAQFLTWMAR